MTKDEVLDGFSFADPAEAEKLRQWLDDATLGTRRRKALVIVGPMCCGKTTLLYRIAEYKGEAPCLYDGRGGIVPAKLSHRDTLRLYRELELCKVILVDDLLVRSNKAMCQILKFAHGFKELILESRGMTKVCEFNISAPIAVAVSADCTERAERMVSECDHLGTERSPYLLVHPTIAKQKKGLKS